MDSSPDRSERLCYYVNTSQQIQTVRLVTAPERSERLVFPGQRWLFEAAPEAWLEIGSALHSVPERISCQDLQVKEGTSLASGQASGQ